MEGGGGGGGGAQGVGVETPGGGGHHGEVWRTEQRGEQPRRAGVVRSGAKGLIMVPHSRNARGLRAP